RRWRARATVMSSHWAWRTEVVVVVGINRLSVGFGSDSEGDRCCPSGGCWGSSAQRRLLFRVFHNIPEARLICDPGLNSCDILRVYLGEIFEEEEYIQMFIQYLLGKRLHSFVAFFDTARL